MEILTRRLLWRNHCVIERLPHVVGDEQDAGALAAALIP